MKYNELKELDIKDWDGSPIEVVYCNFDDKKEVRKDHIDLILGKVKVCNYIITGYNKVKNNFTNETYSYWEINYYKEDNTNDIYSLAIHVYPVEWNRELVKPKRMTNRQLSEWLAKGNGEWMNLKTCSPNNSAFVSNCYSYNINVENQEVDRDIRVRLIGSVEWIEATVDLIKENNGKN